MAFPCNPQCFLLPLWRLALVFAVTWHFSETKTLARIELRGEVGGNVTFLCPDDEESRLLSLYFQRGTTFVNGYYDSKNISQFWENTRVDHNNRTMHMYNLNVSHDGAYECIIRYSNTKLVERPIYLSVTARYSKPAHTLIYCDEHCPISCRVTCFSHGGYPSTKVKWDLPGSQMWKVENSSEKSDPDTMLFNSSSTAYFNCSNGELKSLSCSVGDVRSDMFSVCKPKDPSNTHSPYGMAAGICLGVIVFILIVLLVWGCNKKGKRRAEPVI
ncbi:T-lymphocyte activation antigen CD80-like [Cottoperca gobio]|uniref:T-lymphocyte activation antigen CD80-like n=1 Tax=Cottoperca gobio TaxID=56716 RepID=A0A6J2QWD9_COTGO|nr:T-lymphocyte activation antigen CD80-like [Cottoperca gobio]